jgi:lysozyme
MTVLGIDVSHYQGDVNWHLVSQSDFRFAFIKASDGSIFEDPKFKAHWSGARDAGLLHGAYHFARPGSDPEVQAAFFSSIVGSPAWGELPPVLDLETGEGLSPQAVIDWTLSFVRTAEGLLKRKLMIYTGAFWRSTLGNPTVPELSTRLLWSARYGAEPQVPNTWKRWDFWQFTDGAHGEVMAVPGVTGPCDCDRFRGTFDELQLLTVLDDATLPPAPPAQPPPAWPGQIFVWPHTPVIRNDDVRRWQARMKELGYAITADGAYGPASKKACIALQRDVGLTPDGIVGRATWAATFAPALAQP